MIPVIALVGRPNVGKSTLFNQLTRSRDALVADMPGLTRDRQYGIGRVGEFPYMVVDTGGLSGEEDGVDRAMAEQTRRAVAEADHVLFMVDARDGLTPQDEAIAEQLRASGVRARVIVNKTDGLDADVVSAEFYALALGEVTPIAATHGRGVRGLMQAVREDVARDREAAGGEGEGAGDGLDVDAQQAALDDWPGIRVAVVGRPNAGKSTLVNRILGDERVVATEVAGTTRDSIFVPFTREDQDYTLIDTAGVRRRARVHETVEKFSVVKTLQAIEAAHVVIMVIDARAGLSDQDAHLLGLVIDAGRALVVAVNKWDGMDPDDREWVRSEMQRRLGFVDYARMRLISALHGTNVGHLLDDVREAHASAFVDISTPELTRLLEAAVAEHAPPLVSGRRIKLRYAHQGGQNPPVVVIHGNQTDRLPGAYKRYLENFFRRQLKLVGTPLRLEFRSGKNPYAGRRNKLTPRQQQKRKRLMRHVRKR
ncbi:GTP-binding protein [Thioalkalivibrio sp. ALE21]|uniref:ribosome biogenesis GTPase Der n=1 Tax=Thioalkalivibrio sp. ALE21 TaxID=1158175 RepID=UPI000D958AF7|nr:ribosome biogenesis GTPase Der [Thioalkalivibrio sp. ALE21]PYG00776.1 GTP-binding protein [Thioalkalivibrio sp. ALE21]